MPEWIAQLGIALLNGVIILVGLICFLFVVSLGQYEFRPRQRRREPRPAGQKSNPPRVDTNVQPPRGGSNVQPPREVRCAEYEALGGKPMYRDGKIVGYEWEGVSPVGFQVENVSPGVSLTPLGTTIMLENPDGSDAIEADAPVWGGENPGWHWYWDVEKMFGEYVRDTPRGSLEDA